MGNLGWGGVSDRHIVTSLLAFEMFQERTGFTCSVEEEEARSMGGGHVLGHVADFQVVDETPEEEQEACTGNQHVFMSELTMRNDDKTLTEQQEYPPEPVLPVKVAGEVIGKLEEEEKSAAIIGNKS